MPGPPFKPDVKFALEREAAGCSRESLMLVLPASAIPPEWKERPSQKDMDEEAEVSAKVAAARSALSALNLERES